MKKSVASIIVALSLLLVSAVVGASEPLLIEGFEAYRGDAAIQNEYRTHPDGNAMIAYVDYENVHSGSQSMRFEYVIGAPDWGGVQRPLPYESWEGATGIQFWLKPDGSDRSMTIQFGQSTGEFWEAYVPIMGRTEPFMVVLPFDRFVRPSWNSGGSNTVDLRSISSFSILIGGGSQGSGVLYIDSISLMME